MSTDAATIREIARLVEEARPIREAPDFSATGRYYLRQADGKQTTEYAHRAMGPVELLSTADLAAHAAHRAEQKHSYKIYAAYVGTYRITIEYADPGLPDNEHAQDFVRLKKHPVFSQLERLADGQEFTQRQLITWLRATMNGYVDEATIQHFRSLSFTNDSDQTSEIARGGREHMSRKVAQQIAADKGQDVIDAFQITTPVYDLKELRNVDTRPVEILVDVSTDEDGKIIFTLTSVLDSIRSATEETNDLLRDSLTEALANSEIDTVVFSGE